MKLIKSLIITLISIISISLWAYCFAELWLPPTYQDTTFYYNYDSGWQNEANTDIWGIFKHDDVLDMADHWNAFPQLLELFQLSKQDWYGNAQETGKAIYYIKWIVNMWLWLTAFISLIMVIFAFYMIFFYKENAWVDKAKQILKWVALALVVMWLSRFIVSLFFWLERWTTSENISATHINSNYTNNLQQNT